MKPCAVIVFTKSPEGDVKTRLRDALGAKERSTLMAGLIGQTIERLSGNGARLDWDLHIAYAPEAGGQWFSRFGLAIFAQEGMDLGQRMRNAMERLFGAGYHRVALVGADIPGLDTGPLKEAFALLDSVKVVFGPALDGGYYLVASRQPVPEVFSGIQWSTPWALRDSIERASEAGLLVGLCQSLSDLDTPQDLADYLARAKGDGHNG